MIHRDSLALEGGTVEFFLQFCRAARILDATEGEMRPKGPLIALDTHRFERVLDPRNQGLEPREITIEARPDDTRTPMSRKTTQATDGQTKRFEGNLTQCQADILQAAGSYIAEKFHRHV